LKKDPCGKKRKTAPENIESGGENERVMEQHTNVFEHRGGVKRRWLKKGAEGATGFSRKRHTAVKSGQGNQSKGSQ